MKIIDLLNKIANGEEVPKKIRINGWCYKFEWQDYAGNYLDESEEIDLMSALSCDKEELNKEVEILDDEENGLPEKLNYCEENGLPEKLNYCEENTFMNKCKENSYLTREEMILLDSNFKFLCDKYNEIIDYLENQSKGDE